MNIGERVDALLPYVADLLIAKDWCLVVAESCTGGNLSGLLTSLPGSSRWFKYGLVTYSNQAKTKYLNVATELLDQYGAVSAECAVAMVNGLAGEKNYFGLAITGFAGPEGALVGRVFVACQAPNTQVCVQEFNFTGNRQQIVTQIIYQACRQIIFSSLDISNFTFKAFFAINIEDVIVQKRCLESCLQQGFSVDELEPMNNLHMTLSYQGALNHGQIKDLKALADTIGNITMFDMQLDYCQKLPRGKSIALIARNAPDNLMVLHSLLPTGIVEQDFIPHVTVVKGTNKHIVERQVAIDFKVTSFSLMLSFNGVFYLEHAKWLLNN